MLIIYHSTLSISDQERLRQYDSGVVYWPFSRVYVRDLEIVTDWWISFSNAQRGLIWSIQYSDLIEVRYSFSVDK